MGFAFHAGERLVQERAGVRAEAEAVAGGIMTEVPPGAAEFLAEQPVVVIGHRDEAAVWASILHGPPGFLRSPDPRTVTIAAQPHPDDALTRSLAADREAGTGRPLGLLAIEPATRRRLRINGTARSTPEGSLAVLADEVYANCPKYISTREPQDAAADLEAHGPTSRAPLLTMADRAIVEAADTFFVATSNPDTGADVSHRGGRPGFVQVDAHGTRLTWPDYRGNAMFMTLGNLEIDPAAGLVFPGWSTGDVLQVRGRARTDLDPARAAAFPRAERVIDLDVEEVVRLPGGLGARWRFGEPSKVSPPAPAA